jgi:hypothetical protein
VKDEKVLVAKIITDLDEALNPTVSSVKQNNYKVEAFPNAPDEYELNHPNGSVLVRTGSYRPSLLQGNKQSDFTDIVLSLLVRGLNDEIGLYSLTDITIKAMESVFYGGARFYITQGTPPDIFQDDIWTRDLFFTLPGVHIIGT